MTNTADELLTVDQAAELLNISPRAVRHRITTGTLNARKIGTGRTSAYVIARDEVERVKQHAAAS